MMKSLVSSRKLQEFPAVAVANVRSFIAMPKVAFSEDVASLKTASKDGPDCVTSWNTKKTETADLMKLLHAYKDLGDSKHEPYLKYHNPQTFEDMSAPVPNFRSMNLKAGEVPKFFDSVLATRASTAVEAKNAWWEERRKEALLQAKGGSFKPFPTVPVPAWKYGSSVSMASLTAATDKCIASMEPVRKLKLPPMPAAVTALPGAADAMATVEERGKPVDLKFMSRAAAAKALAARRAQVHDRYLKLWAKKVLVSPESAVVPLKDVDAQLASKFDGVSAAYGDLLAAAAAGPKTFGERVAASPAFSAFLLRRDANGAAGEFETSDAEKNGAAVAAELDDPAAALRKLLGPEMEALGAAGKPMSEQVREITAHKYTPDRYMYTEGMKLADKLAEQEAAEGSGEPLAPAAALAAAAAVAPAKAAEFAKAKAAAGSAYGEYALSRLQAFAADASNTSLEELQNPQLVEEWLELGLAELAEAEAAIDDAEEEELWALTMAAQLKHLQAHFGVDLPHGVLAHMDPLLVKKIDWETTHGLDDWDTVLEDTGSEYAREQWGMESLSHHFLPLIRYRRAKARAAAGKWDAEAAGVVRH